MTAVERATINISRASRSGLLRFAYDLEIPELRRWPLSRFPYLHFYVEQRDHVDVWGLLHSRRDIPATFADTNDA